ncbi:zinc finger protein 235-like isoform X1 [Haliotis rubra]|uniref:zinc finger protein 235-like isoform X1 n=2 Tax=Haliotis rubra TaxID=36100 RepID=UPI001EE53104|nr:zinc finger protein 235-like isoform X1 [Haliotis rubra]
MIDMRRLVDKLPLCSYKSYPPYLSALTMSAQERELLMRLLKQSVLTLCRETISFQAKLEIDGLICITVEDNAQPMVVKIHEYVQKNLRSFSYGDSTLGMEIPPSKKSRRDLFHDGLVVNSPADSSEGLNMSDVSVDESGETSATPDAAAGLQPVSRPSSAPSPEESHKLSEVTSRLSNSLGGGKGDGTEDNEKRDDEERSDSAERDSKLSLSSAPNTSLIPANIHAHSSAMTHPQGLLCKRCFTIVPDATSFDSHNLREHSLFTCKICFKGFTARNNLKRHFRLHTGVRPYKCTMCAQGFTRKDDLKAHVLRHSYNKPFRCGLCGKGYTDRSCVRNHMAKEHHTKLLHVCPQCGEGFNDTVLFSRHKKAHPEFQNFQCDGCSFIGINSLDLMKHTLTHSTKSYTCKPCNQQFTDPFDYSSHLKKHKTDESFTSYCCCFCNTELNTYEHFVRHEYSHAQSRPHSCHFCSKQFRYPSDLKAHVATHTEPVNLATVPRDKSPDPEPEGNSTSSSQYWCTECQIGFASEDSLHGHIYEAHESQRLSRDTDRQPDSDGPAMIELRKEDIDFPNDIAAMKMTPDSVESRPETSGSDKHAPSVTDNIPMVDLSKTKLPHLSAFERKSSSEARPGLFIGPRDMSHPAESVVLNGEPVSIKREIPDHDEELRALQDDFMPSSSDYPGSPGNDSVANSSFDGEQPPGSGVKEIVLERIHIRSPGFERVVTPEVLFRSQSAFQCQVCKENFVDFTNFEFHSSNLHRRFVCEYCGKVFTAKPNRERHVRYHTGERPYKCDLCDQTFFRGDDLKYHRTTRHSGVKPFRCNACGMTFAWAKDLERHMKHYCH